jgi:hypothetical protein
LKFCTHVCSSSKESYSFLVKYLATFAGEDALTLSEAKEEAVRAVIEFVKSPDMFQVCDTSPHLLQKNSMLIMRSCQLTMAFLALQFF